MKTQTKEAPAVARAVSRVVQGVGTSDGAGVELTRVIGSPALNRFDPFLLLDEFRSDRPQDYIAGFPEHPHRGFETVTYLLAGRMRHKDSAGHEGVIEPGGVQWMTAGRGILHSEMPEQENGLLAGFQLWVNLPASHKMSAPAYQEFSAGQVPVERRAGGVELRVIAGQTGAGTTGPVRQPLTEPVYLDVALPARQEFVERLPPEHNACVYVIEGAVTMAGVDGQSLSVAAGSLALLATGAAVRAAAAEHSARFLLVAGRPLNEPVARGGPFVMNTRDEILQAQRDYAEGRLG